jgi:hypothetical protein
MELNCQSAGQATLVSESCSESWKGKKEPGAEALNAPLLALSALQMAGYACSPLGATDVRPQSSHWR